MTTGSLYERLGGEAAINTVVKILYEKILQDDRIKHFFEGVNMANQRMKQRDLLTMAFGGPNNYTGLDLRAGHAHLVAQGLNDDHFNAFAETIQSTLQDMGVTADLISEVMAVVESVRNDVLGK